MANFLYGSSVFVSQKGEGFKILLGDFLLDFNSGERVYVLFYGFYIANTFKVLDFSYSAV